MSNTFQQMTQVQQPGVGKARVGKSKAEEEKEKKTGVKITAAIFFDGTLNNRTNTTERIKGSSVFMEMDTKASSYDAYYSNVAILEYLNDQKKPENKQVSVYMEGPGTLDQLKDNSNGYAFGAGSTGVYSKVSNGITKLIKSVKRPKIYNPSVEYIDKLTIRVFGFSRGAAAARHFISRKAELCRLLGISPAVVEFSFVGLFDTVSSYEEGISTATNAASLVNFKDDVKELSLKLVDPAIKKVVHLTAGNEYRENFSLTTIDSAITKGIGYELQLPGAHSDVGGGYAEIEKEDRLVEPGEFKQLIADGWYTKEQLDLLWARGSRTIPYHYQLIPLAIMVKLATRHGMQLTADVPAEVNLEVPAELAQARTELVRYALAHDGGHRKRVTFSSRQLLMQVRNRYLHRSASEETGMQIRLEDGQPKRFPIPG